MDIGRVGAENVVDDQHKSMTRLNILPAGLETRGPIAREKQIQIVMDGTRE
jgi:hypothetical protein